MQLPETTAVHRAKIEAATLLEGWSEGLDAVARSGGRAAYVFVMGSCAELLASFDLPLVFPEIHCLRSAMWGTAPRLLQRAEEQGYSPDICNYLKADVGLHLAGRHLAGKQVPAPCLAVAATACNTYVKWAEIWQQQYGMPLFVFDLPGARVPGSPTLPDDPALARDLDYVTAQLRELIVLCERITGRRLNRQRLGTALQYTNRMRTSFQRMLELNRRQACFDALRHGGAYLGVYNVFRGTEAGTHYFERALEELRQIQAQHSEDSEEHRPYRLLFVGVPCYPLYGDFIRMFSRHNGIFVASTYLQFASGGNVPPLQHDPARPVASLARELLLGARDAMDSMFLAGDRLPVLREACRADGIVFHAVKSCRTVSTGLTDARRALMARLSVPTLLLESDMMDRRLIAPAQLQNRIDAFFESLWLRRRAGAS
ncbi:MAG: hypothetical protein BWK76_17860 [Desulfobulbaceae bacterium A2]|nr:MAG: hypothetical protein BWK76_17860 [Desulfobulbaceae bacterium A2]